MYFSASLFLIWQSTNLLTRIGNIPFENVWSVVVIAWLLNMFITGIFAFAVFGFNVEDILPDSYYRISNPSRLIKVYNFFKVEWFKKLLVITIWRPKKNGRGYFNGKRDGLQALIVRSKKSDFGHLFPFIIFSIVSLYIGFTGLHQLAIITMLFNLVGNLYPILLQRNHRMRIQAIFQRQNTSQD